MGLEWDAGGEALGGGDAAVREVRDGDGLDGRVGSPGEHEGLGARQGGQGCKV